MRKIILILALVLALLVPIALAQSGHVTLLAVMDNNGNISGSAADLYLEIKPGSGRVFLETFPLTKLDTQISTRFAKDVACKYAGINCDAYDFFYTIKAESPIVGGPSAGAAISTLTVALLTNSDFDENAAISGTINSGGIIGPVGGLKEKLSAAKERGIKRVLIPKGESVISLENSSLNLSDYGSSLGIEIIEVSELDEAVRYFTGKSFEADSSEPKVDDEYNATMKFLAEQLCNKSTSFNDIFRFSAPRFGKRFLAAEEEALDLMDKGTGSLRSSHYYSAASYCFGANVRYRYLSLLAQDLGKKNISEKISLERSRIADFRSSIPKYETITDLQAYGAVIERVEDATLQINISDNYLKAGNEDRAVFALAYATERLDSAYAWSSFFGKKGRKFDLSSDALKESCSRKLAEAEERVQYAQLFYPGFLNSTNNVLDKAYEEQKANNYELCLFKATRAKAEANTVLDIISVDDRIGDVIDKQLSIIRKNIISQTEEGIFPIVSYSYYEYARSLKETDPYSAILYSELAAELSGLDLYFKSPVNGKLQPITVEADAKSLVVFIIGMLLGGLLIFALTKRKKRRAIVTKRRKK